MDVETIRSVFADSVAVKQRLIEGPELERLVEMGAEAIERIQQGAKIMFCGNGGSAADAQHLAAELLVRLRTCNNRDGIPALALAQDTSTITACGNDFGYDFLYERMVRTLGNKGDILIAITTSGNSANVVNAMKAARELGIRTFGFLGGDGGTALALCDLAFVVPSSDTGRIQESHITAGHALMETIEDGLLEVGYLNCS